MSASGYEWSTDKSRFGLKLLQKMGWSEGKGLGREEDGRLDTVRHNRVLSSKTSGIGATAKSETVWKATGVVASGFNEVLGRLAPVGEVARPTAPSDEDNSARKDVGKPPEKQREARGFYERKKNRKNVSGYSQSQLDEIFGGVSMDAFFPNLGLKAAVQADDAKKSERLSNEDKQTPKPVRKEKKKELKVTQTAILKKGKKKAKKAKKIKKSG